MKIQPKYRPLIHTIHTLYNQDIKKIQTQPRQNTDNIHIKYRQHTNKIQTTYGHDTDNTQTEYIQKTDKRKTHINKMRTNYRQQKDKIHKIQTTCGRNGTAYKQNIHIRTRYGQHTETTTRKNKLNCGQNTDTIQTQYRPNVD